MASNNPFRVEPATKNRSVSVNLTGAQGEILDALQAALEVKTGAAVVKIALADLAEKTLPDIAG